METECEEVMNKLDLIMPNTFNYHLSPDQSATGNFECTIFRTSDLSEGGVLVFSKLAVGKNPIELWPTFTEAVKNATK